MDKFILTQTNQLINVNYIVSIEKITDTSDDITYTFTVLLHGGSSILAEFTDKVKADLYWRSLIEFLDSSTKLFKPLI